MIPAKVAAIQTNSSDDITGNLDRIEPYVQSAAAQGCRMVVLPECFAFMQSGIAQLLQYAEIIGAGRIQQRVIGWARKFDLWIVAGSIAIKDNRDDDKVSNTQLVYDNTGECVARYDKIFLFDAALDGRQRHHESRYTKAGDRICVIDTPAGRMGLSICYDLRFPELYRQHVDQGAEILVAPSAFSAVTGPAHWQPLLRARAIENQCYMIAPAQFGEHNKKRKTHGHTAIIDPWGRILAERRDGWAMITADIDHDELRALRQSLPSLQHRRRDIL